MEKVIKQLDARCSKHILMIFRRLQQSLMMNRHERFIHQIHLGLQPAQQRLVLQASRSDTSERDPWSTFLGKHDEDCN